MTVLVFGNSGQVGLELAGRAGVTSLGRGMADLTDPLQCAAKIIEIQPKVVVNAAAYTAVDRAEEEETLAQVINGDAPGEMARACARIGAVFLHISTDYVFDGRGNTPWQVDDETRPIGAYGRTKLNGEMAVASAGCTYAILRTSWVFSPHGANFVKTMRRLGAERQELSIVADQIGGPTAARDIADALMVMADKFQNGTGTSGMYHFSGAPDVSWADFAREIFDQAGLAVEVTDILSEQYPTPAARPKNSRLYCGDILRDFGIKQPDWRQSLRRVQERLA